MGLKSLLVGAAWLSPVLAAPGANLLRRLASYTNETKSCLIYEDVPSVVAPKTNVWAAITAEDVAAVYSLLHDPASGLNLTASSDATVTDNYVYLIDTLHTNKSAVLPYIDGDGAAPAKNARVVIFEGGKEEPVSQEYIVGPLPVSAATTITKLDYIFNGGRGGEVPYNARYFDGKRSAASEPLLRGLMTNISDITVALFDFAYYGSSNASTNVTTTSNTPVSFNGTTASRTVMFRYNGAASYMLPLDFYVLLDVTGTDASTYALKGFVTSSRFFPTEAELRAAFEAGELVQPFKQTQDQEWALLKHRNDMGERDLEDRLAPQNLELGGKRYKLDRDEQYVEYMGWSFYLSFTRVLGLMLYDIRFKGDRVLYELSLQEAAAQYGGFQPKAAGTVYHDTYYHFGTNSATLVEGFDCPFGSTMLNISFPKGNTTEIHPQALCLFEADSGFPLARHRTGGSSDWGFTNLGSVKSSGLGLRTIATVGNYDYMFTYTFLVDGSMEVEVRASGYLQSSPYYEDQAAWGPRIYEATQGSLHDHVVTFKADFDIAGAANSLQVSDLIVVNQTQPWFPELGSFEQIQLNVSNMATEKQFNWPENGQSMFCIVNNNATNAWGQKRGYRLVPGKSNVHLSVMNSPFSRHQTAMSKTHLAVSRQHDNEPYANSWQNINLPDAPQQDFMRFFNGESVDDEDIVVWFNLGMHHFTRAEDVPVTLFTEAVSTIMFAPQNFNDRAQEGDLRNRRWIEPVEDNEAVLAYDDYGVDLPTCKVQLKEPVLGLEPWSSGELTAGE